MDKKKKNIVIIVTILVLALLLVGIILTNEPNKHKEPLPELMTDAVLHESNQYAFFGFKINPSLVSAFSVTGILLFIALFLRIFVIPKFKTVPGKVQHVLEALVGFFDQLAKSNSPHYNKLLGAYIFAAGTYICFGTIFELFGIQAMAMSGHLLALPAVHADINAAISMGIMSYSVILLGGILHNGVRGIGLTLKEFSLPISMSFRLFGALLSGLLVTELVYYALSLSFVLPVVVAVLFTLLHAIIQTYVLTMLTSVFYGEVTEPHVKKQEV